jgi:hypothetical protein
MVLESGDELAASSENIIEMTFVPASASPTKPDQIARLNALVSSQSGAMRCNASWPRDQMPLM